ncbi:MAG: methyltransferase domain-containing protein [Sphingomonas sp.]
MIGWAMHDTAYRIGGLVMDTYLPSTGARILEIGAQNVNGTLRDHAPRNAEYVGLDFDPGDGVDIVVSDAADWPVLDAHFDLVMASSGFEHDKAFWRTFLAMCRKARPGGHIYISAPSNGTVRRCPRDYWRFYPDSGLALEEWAASEGLDVLLVESFVAEREAEVWNDFCAVFRRGPSDSDLNRDFVYDKIPSTNALTWRSSRIINPVEDTEDVRLLDQARGETRRWVAHSEFLNAEFAQREEAWGAERTRLALEVEQQAAHLVLLDENAATRGEELALLQRRAEELKIELDRLDGEKNELDRLNAQMQAEAETRDEQSRQLTSGLGELQSRLAQREEEAAQAWATADMREREREQLAAELEKVRAALVDASGWVEQLALTRTEMERRVARLDKALAKVTRDFEREQQRSGALNERITAMNARPNPDDQLRDMTVDQVSGGRLKAHDPVENDGYDSGLDLEARASDLTKNQEILDKKLSEPSDNKSQLDISRARLQQSESELSESRSLLDECRGDIGSLSVMLAKAQDEIAALEEQNRWLREVARFLLDRGKWWWRFMPLAWQRKKRNRRLLKRDLFDCETYSNRYPDVSSSGQDPFRHYVYHGVTENRRYD